MAFPSESDARIGLLDHPNGWVRDKAQQLLVDQARPESIPLLREKLASGVNHLRDNTAERSEEHTSELQSLMRISYAVFCLKKKNKNTNTTYNRHHTDTNSHDSRRT